MRATFAALLIAFGLSVSSAKTGEYHYFRLYGGGSSVVHGGGTQPSESFIYTVSGPATTVAGQAYVATSSVSGGVGATTYALSSGSLPSGIAINPADGRISGTTNSVGAYNAVFVATDSTGATASAAFHLSVVPTFQVSGSPVAIATVGGGYSATFSGVGGTPPYAFFSSSAFPAGLTLAGNGILSGIPAAAGVYSDLTVSARDADGRVAGSQTFSLTVSDPVAVDWAPPAGVVGETYTSFASVSGGQTPYSLATDGDLPSGLSLGGDGGVRGKPTQSGDFFVAVKATDRDLRVGTSGYQIISIAPGTTTPDPLALSVPPLSAQVGVHYERPLGAQGGSGGNVYSLTSGSLPDGLFLTESGLLVGTPTVEGMADNLQVTVTDRAGVEVVSNVFSIAVTIPPALSISGSFAPTAVVGKLYKSVLTAFDGVGSGYAFESVGAEFPPGLLLSQANGTDGVLSGYPQKVGTYSGLKIKISDASGSFLLTDNFTITVTSDAAVPRLAIVGSPQSYADMSTPYYSTLSGTGGSGSGYVFDISDGALPVGLSLSSDGVISGTVATADGGTFTVRLTDSSGETTAGTYSISVASALKIGGPDAGYAVVGKPYSLTSTASGGRPPFQFSVTGDLPSGLSLLSGGTISGTVSGVAGNRYQATVSVSDADFRMASRVISIPVYDPISVAISPHVGAVGESYQAQPAVSGGDGNYTFGVKALGGGDYSGFEAFGLSFDASTGQIGGTPTVAGTTPSFTYSVVDGVGATATAFVPAPFDGKNYEKKIVINDALGILSPGNTSAFADTLYSAAFVASGGTGGNTFAIASGVLPGWLSLSTTGILSGTPTGDDLGMVGPFTVKVTNQAGYSATSTPFSMVVSNPVTLSGAPARAVRGTSYVFDLADLTYGGNAPYTYELSSGALPEGMTLATSGEISADEVLGASSDAGILVRDSVGRSNTATLHFQVSESGAVMLSGRTVFHAGQPIAGVLGSDFTAPTWSFEQVPAAPALGLIADGTVFRGTAPSVENGLTFTINASATSGGSTETADVLRLTVIPPLAFTDAPSGRLAASVGRSFVSSAPAVKNVINPLRAPVTYGLKQDGAVASIATLCPGLSLSGGRIVGTPSAACSVDGLRLVATDPIDGSTAESMVFELNVTAPLTLAGTPPLAAVGGNYAFDLNTLTSGGVAPYTFALTGSVLPEGMVMDAAGAISATAVTGTTQIARIVVSDAEGRDTTADLTFAVDNVDAIAAFTPGGTVRSGSSLSGTLSTTLPSPAWSFVQTPTSPSLQLTGNGAKLSGTAPTVAASTSFSVVARASAGGLSSDAAPTTITVIPAFVADGGPHGLALTAVQGNPFGPTAAFTVSGAVGNVGFVLRKGASDYDIASACPGLTFSSSTGRISGIPTSTCSTGSITISAIDDYDGAQSSPGSFTLTVGVASATVAMTSSATLRSGDSIAGSLASTLPSSTWTFAQTPPTPSLGLSGAGSVFSGTAPSVSSLSTFSVKATASANGVSLDRTLPDIKVAPVFSVSGGPSGDISGLVGASYASEPMNASGVAGTLTFGLRQNGSSFGSLSGICPGLTFSSATGVVSGAPSSACSLTGLTIAATDSYDGAVRSSSEFSLSFGAPNASAALALTSVRSGSMISGTLSTTLASPTWTVVAEPASPAMTLTPSGKTSAATFTGTAPTVSVATPYSITATAASGAYQAVTPPLDITVLPRLVLVGQGGTIFGIVGNPLSSMAPSSNGTAIGALSYVLLKNGVVYPTLSTDCPGLSFSATTGRISGSPTSACAQVGLAVRGTDTDGAIATTSSTFILSVVFGTTTSAVTSTPTSIHSGQPIVGSMTTTLGNPTWSFASTPASPALTLTASGNTSTATFTGTVPSVGANTNYSIVATASAGGGSASAPAVTFQARPPYAFASGPTTANSYGTIGTAFTGVASTFSNLIQGSNAPTLLKNGQPYTTLSTDCPGLSMNPTSGVISGTPSAACFVTGLQVTAIDPSDVIPAPAVQPTPFTLSMQTAPSMSSTTLPSAIQGQPYDFDLTPVISGGTPPYTLSLYTSGLPAGIAVSGNRLTASIVTGATSGSPRLRIIDADGRNVVGPVFSVPVTPATATMAMAKPIYRTGATISGTLASSLTSPTWSFVQAPVSPALGLAGSGAAFTGIAPNVAKPTDFNVTATATYSGASTGAPATVVTVAPVLSISGGPSGTISSLPTAAPSAGTTAVGGLIYSVMKGGAPYDVHANCGMNLSLSTGVISGGPSVDCPDAVGLHLRATDIDGTTADAVSTFDLSVPVADALTIAGTPPGGTAKQTYEWSGVVVAGGVAPYSFFVQDDSGSAKTFYDMNLILDPQTGRISSAALAAGSWSGTLGVVDAAGNSKAISIAITAAPATLTLSCSGYCGGVGVNYGQNFDATFTASGGVAPYSYSVVSDDALPPEWIASPITSSGRLYAKMQTAGSWRYRVVATDATGATVTSDSINPWMFVVVTSVVEVYLTNGSSASAVTVVGTPLKSFVHTYNSNYTQNFRVSGGWTFNTLSGELPPGITFNTSSGTFSGTPSATGSWTGTVTLKYQLYSSSNFTWYNYTKDALTPVTITVIPAPTISGTPLSGSVGAAYSWTPISAGGRPSYVNYTAATTGSTSLDELGLSIDGATGRISGTPQQSGVWEGTISFQDNGGQTYPGTATGAFRIEISSDASNPPKPFGSPNFGVVGTAYSAKPFSYSGSGGRLPFSYSIVSGSLPDGVILSADGTLSGTPTTSGVSHFTIRLTDADGRVSMASDDIAMLVRPALSIMVPPTTGSAGNQIVSASPVVTGLVGTPTYRLYYNGTPRAGDTSVNLGGLCSGLSFSPTTGVITGVSPNSCNLGNTLAVEVTDDDGTTALSPNFAFNISGASASITIDRMTVRAGQWFTGTVTTSFSDAVWTFTGMPTSMIFEVADGRFRAMVPPGSWNIGFTLTAKATQNGVTASVPNVSGIVLRGPLQIVGGPADIVSGVVGMAFSSRSPSYTGSLTGSLPVSFGLLRNGAVVNGASVDLGGLCAGLSFSSTTGVISGIASAPCSPDGFSLTVTDPNDGSVDVGPTFALDIQDGFAISGTPPNGVGGNPYYWDGIRVVGGAAPYRFFVTDVAGTSTTFVNMGLFLDAATGTISADWLANNTKWSGQIGAVDANGAVVAVPISITSNNNPLTITCSGSCPSIGGINLTAGTPVVNFSNLTVSGGTAPYSWSLVGGADIGDAGLTFAGSGTTASVTGTPSTPGSYTYQVVVSDAAGRMTYYPSSRYVAPVRVQSASVPQVSLNSALPYQWTFSTGGNFANQATTSLVGGTGGVDSTSWSLETESGALPSGLTFTSGTTGVFGGVATAPGSWSGRIVGKDASGNVARSRLLEINVVPASTISGTPPSGMVGVPYVFSLGVTGGVPGYRTFSVSAVSGTALASLGLSINASTGDITGTPTTAGTSTFDVYYFDNHNGGLHPIAVQVRQRLTITVAPSVSMSNLASLTRDNGVSMTPFVIGTYSGGIPPYKAWIYNTNVDGLQVSAEDGNIVLSGTPTMIGASNAGSVTIAIVDGASRSTSKNMTLTLTTPPFVIGNGPHPTACHSGTSFPSTPGAGMAAVPCSGGATAANVTLDPAGTSFFEMDTDLPIKTTSSAVLGAQSFVCDGCSNSDLRIKGWYWQPISQGWVPLYSGNMGGTTGTVPDANVYASKFLIQAVSGRGTTKFLSPN